MKFSSVFAAVLLIGLLGARTLRADFVLRFSDADFAITSVVSNVQTFDFTIDIGQPLVIGSFNDPLLNGVDYAVSGTLASGTPSMFPGFALERNIGGSEFYAQGSALNFEIAAGANLSDGVQVSELAGADPVFVFDGREVNTGRYHPALLQLNSDGTGSIRNSNNVGGVNPSSGKIVDVDYGQEYISTLTFNPNQLTLASVPEPSALSFFGLLSVAVLMWFNRSRWQAVASKVLF